MKFCVMANLSFTLPNLRSQMTVAAMDKVFDKVTGALLKPCWGEVTIAEGTSDDGKPTSNIIIRYDEEEDAREMFGMIKDKVAKIPWLKGRVSLHLCGHDTGGQPCINWESFVKE